MTFKLDFIVCKDHPNKELAFLNQKKTCIDDFGKIIFKTFEWNQIPDFSNNVDMERYRLEIEIFHMNKWREFKSKLLEHFCVYPGSTTKMLEFIKELESFGKLAEDAKPTS